VICFAFLEMNHSNPVVEFDFPSNVANYRIIRNLQHFMELVGRENNLRRNITFEPTIITANEGEETLNLQCRQCEAYFRYVCLRKGEHFTLRSYNQYHQHVLKQAPTFHQSILERINKFLQQEDSKQELHELRAEIEVTYRITSKEFDQLYSQALARLKNSSQLYDGKEI
jgi:hypothetical protein